MTGTAARTQAFGVFEVDREARELRKQGQRIRLQDQPFQVLCTLLDRAGKVVTRDELRAALWPESVYVDFDHGLNNSIARLREALGDSASSPSYIETLPRHGYRFIYPLSQAHSQRSPDEPGPVVQGPIKRETPRHLHVLGAIGIVIALAITLWLALRAVSNPDHLESSGNGLAVAVLPFSSLSANVDDEYFASGLSEEIANQLAATRQLRVVGRMSSMYYKERQDSPDAIAKALNANYLLDGTVRRSNDRVRITAQLLDGRTGEQLWSQTFERELGDIFAIEDEIALAVASALQVRLIDSDEHQAQSRGSPNVEAVQLYLMGSAKLRARGVRLDREGALRLFEQAIALDPGYAAAHAGIASYYYNSSAVVGQRIEEGLQRGRAAAERALALDPNGSETMRVMANFEMSRYRSDGAYSAYEHAQQLYRRAIEVDPSNSYAHFDYARAIQWYEQEHALGLFEQAATLEPLVPVPVGLGALAMSRLGMQEAAGLRMQKLVALSGPAYSARNVAAYEIYNGRLDSAVLALRAAGEYPLEAGSLVALWSLYLSLGDSAAAAEVFTGVGDDLLLDTLRSATARVTAGDYSGAFELLDERRAQFPTSHILDLPVARLALVVGVDERAREILEYQLRDIASGVEPVTAPRLLPALDLVLAWSRNGESDRALELLERLENFLESDDAPRLPLFTVQRARASALRGQDDKAFQALEQAYMEGFRGNCVLDLYPQPMLYIDCIDVDPAFDALRAEGRFDAWLSRIREDNRTHLEQLRSRLVADEAA